LALPHFHTRAGEMFRQVFARALRSPAGGSLWRRAGSANAVRALASTSAKQAGSRRWRWAIGAATMGATTFALASSPLAISMEKPVDIVLYQYEVCPFCCKVKAFLNYCNIPYRVVEVNPLMKKELAFSKDYRKVPVLIINGKQLNGSDEIINELTKEFGVDQFTVGPLLTKEANEDANKWREWVNERFVRVITVNIYRTMKEAYAAFDYITVNGNFNFFEKHAAIHAGAILMYAIAKRYNKKFNFAEERQELKQNCDKWAEEGLDGKKFHGGQTPSLADLSVYGVISAVEGLDTFDEIMKNEVVKVWYNNVKSLAKSARLD